MRVGVSFTHSPPQVHCLGSGDDNGRNIKEKQFERFPGYNNCVTRKRYYRPSLLFAEKPYVSNGNSGMPLGTPDHQLIKCIYPNIDDSRQIDSMYPGTGGRHNSYISRYTPHTTRLVSRLGRATMTNTNVYVPRQVGWVLCAQTPLPLTIRTCIPISFSKNSNLRNIDQGYCLSCYFYRSLILSAAIINLEERY